MSEDSIVSFWQECIEFFPGAFDAAIPRKGGTFPEIPADHDVTDEYAAYKLCDAPWPGMFGTFLKVNRPTKNANEAKIIADSKAKVSGLADWQILQKNFDRMK